MARVLAIVAVAVLAATVDAAFLRQSNSTAAVRSNTTSAAVTFQSWYNAHKDGRGIWKWWNALEAYQRHFGSLAGTPLKMGEVGVQSGGSLLMWKNVLGPNIKMYGFDINPACKSFEEKDVTVTIGDQGDPKMWDNFFVSKTKDLDILLDDGGHEPHQMLTTLTSAFASIKPGGYLVIEDIAGTWYLDPMFKPAANFIGQMGQIGLVDSVHIYPLVLVVRKGGFAADSPQASQGIKLTLPQTDVADFSTMWTAINSVQPGSQISLKNPQWTNLFSADSLSNFFTNFIDLHASTFKDTPAGCSTTANPVCTNEIQPMTHLQSRVSGVHIYKDHAVIEVPAAVPWIGATRKGSIWINYR